MHTLFKQMGRQLVNAGTTVLIREVSKILLRLILRS